MKQDKAIDKIVYVVTRSEEHSDYVEAVFFDKENAEKYCKQFNDNEDEKIRKQIISFLKEFEHDHYRSLDFSSWIDWLEKQGQSKKTSIWKHWKDGIAGNGEGKPIFLIKNGSTYNLSSCLSFECDYIELSELDNLMLEKQNKQEQLYIRFGDIPTDEKSKIYKGEIEVGTENGVSVYPGFKTSEGDIVLGLSLPITKTTLHTQQHLIEYDDRPCYLVKGDYVGKDTDGQPLINSVSIIEKIDTYRVKESKQ